MGRDRENAKRGRILIAVLGVLGIATHIALNREMLNLAIVLTAMAGATYITAFWLILSNR